MVLRLLGMELRRCTKRLRRTITTLPEQLKRSLTWDQGAEMAQHARLTIDCRHSNSTSAIHRVHGNAPPTRIPMGFCASTFRRAPI